jgi:hypothetical protein
MAKRKSNVNKSAAIREYFAENPKAKPKAVVVALAEKGVSVNAAFVSMIKTKMKKTGGLRGVRKVRAVLSRNGHSAITVADLLLAKEMANRLGGAARAREALDALAKLA